MSLVRYLTHPQVAMSRTTPVPEWGLNDVGVARVAALLGAREISATTRVISSAEVKALETASPLANSLGLSLETCPEMHENDRSATGFLPPDEFEQVADQFFAHPTQSIRGWERAIDAQSRILREVESVLADHSAGDVLIVGHGGVGTLLYCVLAGVPISRTHDQGPGGGGNWFAFDLATRTPLHGWRAMEELA